MVDGYAYVDEHEKIDVKTVSHSVVGAMVNALYLRANVIVTNGPGEEEIRASFEEHCAGRIGEVIVTFKNAG